MRCFQAGRLDPLRQKLSRSWFGGSSLTAIRSVQIASAAPVIRAVTVNRTSGGFEVAITGLSNTREVTQAIAAVLDGATA